MEVSIKITFVYCSLFLLAYGILLLVTVQHAQALTSAEVATNRTDTDTITDERTEKQALDGNSTIDGEGDTLTIEEGGSVTDNTADSVVVDNDDNTVTNKGSITVSGANKTGVNMQSGSNNTLNNFGTISVDAGITGTAVNINANTDSTVNNYGTISISSSTNSTGINTRNSSATINNYGTISVNSDGASSRAIRIDGTGYTINNFGTIEVTGENDIGILFVTSANDTNTINNSGSITASGTSSFAIQGSDGDETLNLQSGSRIIGAIDLAGGTDKVTISGRNISSTLTIENAETFNLHVPGIVVGNVVTTVDPTGQSVKGPVLNSLCTGLHGVLHKRLASFKPAPINLASTRIEPGMLAKSKQPQAWGNMFHSYL